VDNRYWIKKIYWGTNNL